MWEMDIIVIITTIIHTVQTDTVSSMVRTCTETEQISSTVRTCTEWHNQQYGQNMYGNGAAQGGDAQNSYGTSQQQSWNDEYNNKDYE